MKGNLHENAARSFRRALELNPMVWEAFEGLCAIGMCEHKLRYNMRSDRTVGDIPPIEALFPPRPAPVLLRPAEVGPSKSAIPFATGAGFFTPDAGSAGNRLRAWKPKFIVDLSRQRDSMFVFGVHCIFSETYADDNRATTDSSFYGEPSFQGPIRPSWSQPTTLAVQPPAVRPLSSADEAGPVTKKLRSTVRQRTAPPSTTAADAHHQLKPSKSTGAIPGPAQDDRTKGSKAPVRPYLSTHNVPSYSLHAFQTTTASRFNAVGAGKPPAGGSSTRRSTRLQSGGSKLAKVVNSYPHALCSVMLDVSFALHIDGTRSQASSCEDTIRLS